MEMSLASAFRYRNKIKKCVGRMTALMEGLSVAIECDDVERQKDCFVTKSYDGDVQMILLMKDLLKVVNVAIDNANYEARELINEINACKEKIDFLERIHSNIACTKLYVVEHWKDEPVKTPLIPLYEKKWGDELDEVHRELFNYENKLNDFNGRTRVSFEIDERLARMIEAA